MLTLSALGARDLHGADYRFELAVDWLPGTPDVDTVLRAHADSCGRRRVAGDNPTVLPRRLWSALVAPRPVSAEDTRWADLGREPAPAPG